jgi:hypothetical protein
MGCGSASAQTIRLEFLYFAGSTYEFKIVQGNTHIVLQKDTIPRGGKVQLQISLKYKGYKGMFTWYLTNSATGGGLEMVINQKDFSVSCLDSVPTAKSIVYKNSPENMFKKTNYQEQQAIFAKHDAMLAATKAYDKKSMLYGVFKKEYNTIIKEYNRYVKKLKNTNLYAARFREITNLTRGIGTIITQDENLKAKNINNSIVHQLDFEHLFTSNHWGAVINTWVQLQVQVLKKDALFIIDVDTILKRMPAGLVYTEFVSSVTKALINSDKEALVIALSKERKEE